MQTAKKPVQAKKFTIVDGDSSDDSFDSEDLSKPIIQKSSTSSMDKEEETKAVPAFHKKPALAKGAPLKRMNQSSNSLDAKTG